jgi:hypothetical protein
MGGRQRWRSCERGGNRPSAPRVGSATNTDDDRCGGLPAHALVEHVLRRGGAGVSSPWDWAGCSNCGGRRVAQTDCRFDFPKADDHGRLHRVDSSPSLADKADVRGNVRYRGRRPAAAAMSCRCRAIPKSYHSEPAPSGSGHSPMLNVMPFTGRGRADDHSNFSKLSRPRSSAAAVSRYLTRWAAGGFQVPFKASSFGQ